MKRTWLRTGALAATLALAAPAVSAQQGGQTGGTQAHGQATTAKQNQQTRGGDEKEFVRQMFMSNMAEIELGKLATERASSDDVKSFAQTMITHHTQANSDLATMADDLKVERPTELDAKHRAVADRLSKLSGEAFDRAYMQAMVASHRETVAKVKPKAGKAGAATGTGTATGTSGTGMGSAGATSSTGAGAAVKSVPHYAAKTLPIVQKHLQEAERLQKNIK